MADTPTTNTITFRDFSTIKEVEGKLCRVFTIEGGGDYSAPQVIGAGHRDRTWQNVGHQVASDPDRYGFPKVGTPKEQEEFFKRLKWSDVIAFPYAWKLALLDSVLTPLNGAVPVKDLYDNATGITPTQLDCITDFIDGNVKSRTFELPTS